PPLDHAGVRRDQAGHLTVLRHRCLHGRHRSPARHPPQSRRRAGPPGRRPGRGRRARAPGARARRHHREEGTVNVLGPDLFLVIAAAVLSAGGVYLVLERPLRGIAVGLVLVGHVAHVLVPITGGPRGGPPGVARTPEDATSGPLPQATILTAIVIALALTAFLGAMAKRSWQLQRHDEVQD